MEVKRLLLWRGARPMIGAIVGVGIFGLPYVFSQAGYAYGLIELVIVGALSLISLFIFADLLAINKEHVRFVAVISNQLGLMGRILASIAFLGALWGGMLAYIIVGGQFAANVFSPIFGGSNFTYQMIFWVVSSAMMIGGPLFVRKLQGITIPIFFILIGALTVFSIWHVDPNNLTVLEPTKILLPFGALLFAFSGFAAVPETREALGRNKTLVRPALALAVVLIAGLYALFTLAVVGITGPLTTVQSVDGLGLVVAPWLAIFVSAIGLCTVFTAYISVGIGVMSSLIYDFKGRFLSSWWLTIIIPACIFLAGARDFIHVISTTGGLLGALGGIVLLVAYEKARLTAQLPKRALAIPQGLVALAFILFAAMGLITIWTVT